MKRRQLAAGICVALIAPYIAALNLTEAKSLQILWSALYAAAILAVASWGNRRFA